MSKETTQAETPAPQPKTRVPDLRGLAIEIVDGIRGYTFEFSSHPAAHKDDYDFIEEKLRAAFAGKSHDEYQAEFAIGYRDGYSDGLKDGAKTPEAKLRYISTQWPGTSAGKYARAALASEGQA